MKSAMYQAKFTLVLKHLVLLEGNPHQLLRRRHLWECHFRRVSLPELLVSVP